MAENKKCPCGSGSTYSKCCEAYIEGNADAMSPEILMRSRYTAYTKANIDYIGKTMAGKAKETYDVESSKDWAEKSEWLGLTILKAEPVRADATTGSVDFMVKYKANDIVVIHREISEFNKIDGSWYYVEGIVNPKVGRNDPCFCGSGKKSKKCCG